MTQQIPQTDVPLPLVTSVNAERNSPRTDPQGCTGLEGSTADLMFSGTQEFTDKNVENELIFAHNLVSKVISA